MADLQPTTEATEAGNEFFANLRAIPALSEDYSGIQREEETILNVSGKEKDRKNALKDAEHNPILFIGLGGTGLKAVDEIKRLMILGSKDKKVPAGIAFLGFDCNRDEPKSLRNLQANSEVFIVTLRDPKETYRANKEQLPWVTQKWFPKDAEFGAAQFRQVSRMVLMTHHDVFRREISRAMTEILPIGEKAETVNLDVYIVTSLCGGAGGGMYTDIAVIVRDLVQLHAANATLFGVFVTGDVYLKFPKLEEHYQRFFANTYACLKELQYFQNPQTEHNTNEGRPFVVNYPDHVVELRNQLFDLVLLVQSSNAFGKPTIISEDQLKSFLASSLYLMSVTPVNKDNKKAVWVNPGSGWDKTSQDVEGSPRLFCSLGYAKYMYPEKEFINYLNGYYGELVLRHYLDAVKLDVPEEQRKDPKLVSIKDYISKLVEQRVEQYYEMEDLQRYFDEGLRHFRFQQDVMMASALEIVENEDWESVPNAFSEFEGDFLKQLEEKSLEIKNISKRVSGEFNHFLDELPAEMLEKGAGVHHLLEYFNHLLRDLDAEEALTIKAIELNEKSKERNRKEYVSEREQVSALIKDRPLMFPRRRLRAFVESYVRELSEYLNDRLKEIILKGIIETFRAYDGHINDRAKVADKILSKFDGTMRLYQDHRRNYEIFLKSIAGEKKAYDRHMEFSVVDLKELDKYREQLLQSNPPEATVRELFGRSEKKYIRKFWEYNDKRYTPEMIMDYMQSAISPFFGRYRKTLAQVAEELEIERGDLLQGVKELVAACRAQWMVMEGTKWGVKPVNKVTVGYPDNYKLEPDTPNSTSDRTIEMLRIEYAMPGPLLTSARVWKQSSEREERLKDREKSLHIFPEAYAWNELDEFQGKQDTLLLFALGLAFGHVMEPSDDEKKAIREKYKKDYRNFIFRSGNHYFLMPNYELPVQKANLAARPINLGNGRIAAYQTFKSNLQHSEIVREWIQQRIVGRDVDGIVSALQQYLNEVLDEETRGIEIESATADKALAVQAESEKKEIRKYIETAKKSRSLYVPE